jgi:hypothetical protein
VDSAFTRLFTGIQLTRDTRAQACALLRGLESEQQVVDSMLVAAGQDNIRAATAVRVQRDSALRALVGDDDGRTRLAGRTSPGARSGGAGGGRAGARSGTAQSATEAAAEANFRRLFEGIVLTQRDSARARVIILRAQQQMSALRSSGAPILGLTAGAATVSMRPPSDAQLAGLLLSDAERALVRSRIVTTQR